MTRSTRCRDLVAASAACLISACGASTAAGREAAQTEAEGYAVLCNESVRALRVRTDVNDPAIQGPDARIRWLSDWVDTHVTNETVMSEFRTLASTPDRSAALVERSRAAGVAECAFATEIWTPSEASTVDGEASALAEPELSTTAELPGTLAGESIREVVRRKLSQVRFCYEQALSADVPARSGQVVVSFVIGESGAVESAEIASSTLGSATVESCIVARVSGWTFSAPRGGRVGVRYPFGFGTE